MYNHILCPVCSERLKKEGPRYCCEKGHSFDLASGGYLHLLLSCNMHSKLPGDNPDMTRARRLFLQKGYYGALLHKLYELSAGSLRRQKSASPVVVDGGCGEGYYTGGLCRLFKEGGFSPEVYGFDISKSAVKRAAKQNPGILFSVASLFDLPLAASCARLFFSIFAPLCPEEFARVTANGGELFVVAAGADHLIELKELLYERPYKNEEKAFSFPGFSPPKKTSVTSRLVLSCGEDIENLFQMTPYSYRTPPPAKERLKELDSLTLTAAFDIFSFIRE